MKLDKFDLNENVFIIAEISANHGHDIKIAKDTIKAAKESGADAIKIQTYTADTLTIDCDNEYFTLNSGTIWDGMTLYDLYKEAYTPWEWHSEIQSWKYRKYRVGNTGNAELKIQEMQSWKYRKCRVGNTGNAE